MKKQKIFYFEIKKMIRLSEQVRRLEDTITSLRRDNKELRDKLKNQEPPQKEFMITYK